MCLTFFSFLWPICMLSILNGILTSLSIFILVYFSYYLFRSRYSSLKSLSLNFLSSMVNSLVGKFILLSLFVVFFVINLTGNIPLNSIPTLFYSQTVTISLLFWVPIIVCVSFTQLKDFLGHMLPYGSPVGLMLFLPLVEIFSQLMVLFTHIFTHL